MKNTQKAYANCRRARKKYLKTLKTGTNNEINRARIDYQKAMDVSKKTRAVK